MTGLTPSRPARTPVLVLLQYVSLAAANAACVASLYWNQALVQSMAAAFPASAPLLSLIPMLTLAGYASGVAVIAFAPAAGGKLSTGRLLTLLVVALLAAGAAPNVPILAVVSFVIGFGAAAAQRLIANAARLGGPDRAGIAIGVVLGAALLAILGVRLAGDTLAHLIGWRAVFYAAAACVGVSGLVGVAAGATHEPSFPAPSVADPMRALWRGSPLFRWATFQQMALFAAYNAAWMIALIEVPARERSLVVIGGCGAGLVAALGAGRLVDRLRQRDVPRVGAVAVLVAAALLLPVAYSAAPGVYRVALLLPGMALLDGGLQFALVANQARVQALMPTSRSRLAATLTVAGSFGGGIGAGASFWLWQRAGWPAALAVAAVAGLCGLACSLRRAAEERRAAARTPGSDEAAAPTGTSLGASASGAPIRDRTAGPLTPMLVRTRVRAAYREPSAELPTTGA